ncbi:MAG: SDR family NAD(P)-dependent oxidoreductase [Polyangiales bacterium]
MDDFAQKVAVVTGGASGIGRELGRLLANEGARVVLADIDQEALDQTVASFAADGLDTKHIVGIRVDITKPESVAALADHVFERFENVHLLFNNAGVGIKEAKRRIWTLPDADWQWGYAVNVMGVANGIRAFVPTMLEKGQEGHVINTSSGNGGLVSMTTTPIYASTKAAVTSLTEVLHYQFLMDDTKLHAHVLFPGPYLVNTNILNSARNKPRRYQAEGAAPEPYTDMKALAESVGVSFKLTEPDEVARQALEGIRNNRFWIMEPGSSAEKWLKTRTESILERRNPGLRERA